MSRSLIQQGSLQVVPESAAFAPTPTGMSFVSGAAHPLTRRVSHILGDATYTNAASVLSVNQRTIITLPLPSVRWRLKVANQSAYANTALTTPVTVTGVHVGTPTLSTSATGRRWTGDATAALTQLFTSFSVPTDGTFYTSAWITDPTLQFGPSTGKLFSLGLTTTATGTGIVSGAGLQTAVVNTAGSGATHAGDQTISGLTGYSPPGVTGAANYLDVVIEYEFIGTSKIGLFIGDSITAGVGDGDTTATMKAALSHETFAGAAALRGNFAFVNLGIPSAGYSQFDSTSKRSFTRADLTTTVPDFAVIAIGTNNLGTFYTGNVTLHNTLIDLVVSLGIPRSKIFVSTLLPRTDTVAFSGTVTTASSVSATSLLSSVSIASGTVISIGNGRSVELLTTSGAPTGSGPYTIPVPAMTKAHAVGEQIIWSQETSRQYINDWLRQVPNGTGGCLDFEQDGGLKGDWIQPDLRLFSADGLHPLRALYQRMATRVASLGRSL